MKLLPTEDKVVVQVVKGSESTKGGIILPDGSNKGVLKGRVLAVGPGRVVQNGGRISVRLSEGDLIYFAEYAGHEIDVDGDKQRVIGELDVIAVVRS